MMGPVRAGSGLAEVQPLPRNCRSRGFRTRGSSAAANAPGGQDSINEESPITSGLAEIFFPVPGVIEPAKDSELKFTHWSPRARRPGRSPSRSSWTKPGESRSCCKLAEGRLKGPQVIAARIQGKLPEDKNMSDAGTRSPAERERYEPSGREAGGGEAGSRPRPKTTRRTRPRRARPGARKPADAKLARRPEGRREPGRTQEDATDRRGLCRRHRPDDLHLPANPRSAGRGRGDLLELRECQLPAEHHRRAGRQEDYIGIRKRKPYHGTLQDGGSPAPELSQEEVFKRRIEFQEEFDTDIKKAESREQEGNREVREEAEGAGGEAAAGRPSRHPLDRPAESRQRLGGTAGEAEPPLQCQTRTTANVKRDENIGPHPDGRSIGRSCGIKNWYKFWAVIVPPIPPLLVGLVVFVRRRLREREGVAKARMR